MSSPFSSGKLSSSRRIWLNSGLMAVADLVLGAAAATTAATAGSRSVTSTRSPASSFRTAGTPKSRSVYVTAASTSRGLQRSRHCRCAVVAHPRGRQPPHLPLGHNVREWSLTALHRCGQSAHHLQISLHGATPATFPNSMTTTHWLSAFSSFLPAAPIVLTHESNFGC